MFKLSSPYEPAGDQPQAIAALVSGINEGVKTQLLEGVTGSGKTFTMANVIAETGRSSIIVCHSKILAEQIHEELKGFFPEDNVFNLRSEFYAYVPESLNAKTGKHTKSMSDIDPSVLRRRKRLHDKILSGEPVIVVTTSTVLFAKERVDFFPAKVKRSEHKTPTELMEDLERAGYVVMVDKYTYDAGLCLRNGDRVTWNDDDFLYFVRFHEGNVVELQKRTRDYPPVYKPCRSVDIKPRTDYLKNKANVACYSIMAEMEECRDKFRNEGKLEEAERIEKIVKKDVRKIKKDGYCNGLSEYLLHIEQRDPKTPPRTIFDFRDDWLVFVDESHLTIPLVKSASGMVKKRKRLLIDSGYRLPSSICSRPITLEEFTEKSKNVILVTATPSEDCRNYAEKTVKQLVRANGAKDPEIHIVESDEKHKQSLKDCLDNKGRKTIVMATSTKEASSFRSRLSRSGLKASLLSSSHTVQGRLRNLTQFKNGLTDVLVSVNLLKEGVDIPQVEFVRILNAGEGGFLRSTRSLLQIAGRAARHSSGKVVLYSPGESESVKEFLRITKERQAAQSHSGISPNPSYPSGSGDQAEATNAVSTG